MSTNYFQNRKRKGRNATRVDDLDVSLLSSSHVAGNGFGFEYNPQIAALLDAAGRPGNIGEESIVRSVRFNSDNDVSYDQPEEPPNQFDWNDESENPQDDAEEQNEVAHVNLMGDERSGYVTFVYISQLALFSVYCRADMHVNQSLDGSLEWTKDFGNPLDCPPATDNDVPRDHVLPFDKHSTKQITKGMACVGLFEVFSRHGIKQAAVNDILDFFYKNTSSLNLPIIERNPCMFDMDECMPMRNNIQAYVGTDERNCVLDICKKECMVFHGMRTVLRDNVQTDVDCSKEINCVVCGTQRYTKCTQLNCISKDYASCNPFKAPPNQGHNAGYRVPMKSMYYRPLLLKLIDLYKKSLTNGFTNFLNYDNIRKKRDHCVIDILDGVDVQQHYREMNNRFEHVKREYENATPGQTLHQCSLGLSIFYDGATNFQRKSDSMYPLLVSVINCNPSDRAKLGRGLFLAALHNVKPGSGAEEYLLDNIFTSELKRLENGLILRVPHPHDSHRGEVVHVFMQARVIFAHMDTIELQHFIKIHGTNSGFGCNLCGQMHGSTKKCLNKTVYIGHRSFLHRVHLLRKFGQNQTISKEEQDCYYHGLSGDEVSNCRVT
jgi:hypothetical protein